MSRILVCPTQHAETVAREWAPSHALGFAAPGEAPSAEVLTPWVLHHLRLVFNDVGEPRPGFLAPSRVDLARLVAFGAGWDGSRPLLIHCRMGISRSTAAALILASAVRPEVDEEVLALRLRFAQPCATPNPLMIALADDCLDRRGRLVAAARSIGRGADYRPYRSFSLDLAALA